MPQESSISTNDRFRVAVERVLGHEGGYVFHPADPGGETNWGITKRLAWRNGYRGEMKDMIREQAIDIYERAFWLPLLCDTYPFALAFQLFDYAINSGFTRAIRDLQAACGILDDGILGPQSFRTFRTIAPAQVLETYLSRRLAYLQSLPTWPVFGKGWTNRIERNRSYLKDDIHSVR